MQALQDVQMPQMLQTANLQRRQNKSENGSARPRVRAVQMMLPCSVSLLRSIVGADIERTIALLCQSGEAATRTCTLTGNIVVVDRRKRPRMTAGGRDA